jgi:hypothetical protein
MAASRWACRFPKCHPWLLACSLGWGPSDAELGRESNLMRATSATKPFPSLPPSHAFDFLTLRILWYSARNLFHLIASQDRNNKNDLRCIPIRLYLPVSDRWLFVLRRVVNHWLQRILETTITRRRLRCASWPLSLTCPQRAYATMQLSYPTIQGPPVFPSGCWSPANYLTLLVVHRREGEFKASNILYLLFW